jgi:hypothetical protein
MIKKQGNKFVVTNKAGTKVLGTHPSKEKAQKQLAAIEISKAKHMHENKSFKAFRSTLNESEYSEVLTGYGNRSAHKDDAGLHHLQSAGALAGINAMLATIGKGTYLDPNEAFLKMKVRLNVVQLDFAWKPGSWDGGVGSYDIPVVQFGRVDGYDAQTGQIRFDGKANPTGGYTELNLHVDVELTPESLYVVSAKLTPAATVAEEVEVAEAKKGSGLMTDIHNPKGKAVMNKSGKVLKYYGKERSAIKHATTGKAVKEEVDVNEDYQTPTREREMDRKIAKHDDAADSAYRTRMTKYGKVADRASKSEDKHDKAIARLLKRSQKEQESSRTYGRSGKLVKRGSRAEVKEETEQLDETMTRKHFQQVADLIKSHPDAKKREELAKHHSEIFKKSNPRFDETRFRKACGVGGCQNESVEQIDEAGAAKMARMGYAYDRARVGARGVLNPERKQQMRDAYYKQREKVEANKAKRVAAGTFDKARELEALHKKYEIRRAKNAVNEEIEQIDELSKATKDAYVAKRGSQLSSMLSGHTRGKQLTGKQQANAVKGIKQAMGGSKDKSKLPKLLPRMATFAFGEELVGGQKKLDVNKNKRLDAQDFKMLRAKKKAMSEAKKPMIKIGLNPNKKIGYEVASIGAGGKKTVEKSVDYTMPHVKRDTNKKGVNEAKMKIWSPRLDRLMANRDAIRSRPKKSILTQKVQDGKKMGAARPIAKYEGK